MLSERLALLVSLDAQGAVRGLEGLGKTANRNLGMVESKADRAAVRFKQAGVGMLATAGILATGLYKAGQSAADLEQAVGGTEAVFKDVSGVIDDYAKNSAQKMGLSERAFREATTSMGGQLKALGFNLDDSAQKSIELTGIAADLAATYGGTTAEAVQALGAAFRGEADPAERFNLRLNQTTVNAKAVEMGLASSTSQVDAQAKAQATLALITEQSADAQGQFAREAGSASGAMQIANAEFEDAKAALGQAVAPAMADVAGKAAGLAKGFSDLNEKSGGMLSSLATYGTIGLTAAGGLSLVIGKVIELRDRLKNMGNLGTAGMFAGIVGGAVLLGKGLEEAFDRAEVSVDQLSKMVDEDLVAAFLTAQQGFEALGKDGMEPFRAIAEQSIGTAERLRDAMADAGTDTSEFDAVLREVNTGLEQQASDAGRADSAVGGLGGAMDDAADSGDDLESAIKGISDALRRQFDPLFAAQDAMLDLEEAQQAVIDAEKEYGRNSSQAAEARRNVTRAALDQEQAMLDLSEAVEAGDVELGDARATLERWVAEGKITKQAADEAAFAFGVLGANAEGVPESVSTTVDAPGLWTTSEGIRILRERIGQLPGSVSVYVGQRVRSGAMAEGGLVPQYFAGGGGPRGTDTVPAWLTPGEFVMSRPAVDRIGVDALAALNAGSSASLTGRGGSQTIIVQLGEVEVARVVANAAASGARRGIG